MAASKPISAADADRAPLPGLLLMATVAFALSLSTFSCVSDDETFDAEDVAVDSTKDDFTLRSGDVVRIEIGPIGVLENAVA